MRPAFHFKRALSLVWESAQGWTLANLAVTLVQGVLPLLSLYLMKLVVDGVTAGLSSADKGQAFGRAALYIGLLGAVALAGALLNMLGNLISENQIQIITDHIQDVLHAKSVEVDLEFYENPQYFDTLHRAQQEAPSRPSLLVNGLIKVAQSGLTLSAITALLFSFHWSVAVLLFAASAPGILVRLRFSHKLYRWQRDQTPSERMSWYYHWLLTGSEHAKEVRLFDLGALFRGRFRELRRTLRRERLSLLTRRSRAEFLAQAGAVLAIFGAYAFIAQRTIAGMITLGGLVMYFQAFQRGQGYLQDILGGLAGLYENNLFLSYLDEFLSLKPAISAPAQPHPVPQPLQTGIRFEHVSFRYSPGTRMVLEDVSLTIKRGQVVALVGHNGSGKTTLAKLLCRLYDPASGTITLDGKDLRHFSVPELRREISVIFQDYAQYYLSAKENIWLGNIRIGPEDGRVIEAARNSGADEFIRRFPRAYETPLGKWFEDGEEISIGEWQKIALARAFLRDSQIIILDEPTSSLDAEAEYEVFRKFRELAAGRSAVLISHRFSTVRMADMIYVLEGGRIIEGGSHEDLLGKAGTYARLFELQARNYR